MSRHLRIFHYDDKGDRIPTGKISNALVPAATVPGTKICARQLVTAAHAPRRSAAQQALLAELKRRRAAPTFSAVALLMCPGPLVAAVRSPRAKTAGMTIHLTPTTSYCGSFAVIAPWNNIYVSDVMTWTLTQAEEMLEERIKSVLVDKLRPGRRAG